MIPLWTSKQYFLLVFWLLSLTTISIGQTPDIPIITGPTFILDGNSVTLTCTSTGGNPAPTVYWYRVNKLLDTTFNTTNGVTTNTYNFVANGSHHIAVFECRVNSSELESYLSATWYFQVYIEPSQPTLTGPQTLLTGNTYQWTCISTGGNPSPTMTLRIGNSQFSTGITQSSVLQSDSTHTVTVSLSWNPSISNNGQTLFCDVQHSETRGNNLQTASLQLTVNDPLSVNAPQTQYQQNVGTLVVMNCVITGTATSISWYFNNQVINIASSSKYSNGNTINPSLTVSNVALSDAGQYYCQATNGLVTANSNTITLTVLDIPSVNLQQSIYNVNYGSSVVLVCSVTANPVHTTVYWRKIKNGVTTDINVVNSNNKYSGSSVSSPSLQINNVDLNDEAYYVCFATNSVGSGQSSQTFLDVIGGFLNITIPQSSYSVLIGQQVTISCTVTGTPTQTNVFWSKVVNGVLTNVGINGNGRYSGGTTSAPSLTITNTQRSDEGTYVCYATNIVGTSNSQNTFLDVTGGVPIVQVSFLRYQINFGGSITLGCSVVSNPAHFQVYWRKTIGGTTSNVDVTNSGGKYSGSTLLIPTLTINNAALSDEANYTCYATNIVGTGQSATTLLDVVGNLPTVSIQQSIYNVNYGSSVVLVCSVTANPAHTTVYWRKIKNGITTDITVANSNNKYSGSSVSSPSLQINNADLTDEGHYACFATNVIGTAQSAQAFLDVTGGLLTITIPQSSYSVLIGQQVTISCTVTGTPTQNNVFWRKVANGVQIDLDINENSRYSGGTSPTPSLTITNTQRSDEGIYVCYATNIVGTSNSQNTFLDVTGGVPIVQVSFLRYQINFGGSITLGCSVVSNPANFQVYWRKTIGGTTSNIDVTNSGGKYSGSTLLIPTLTINDAALSDEANYTCYATNIVGTGQSATTLLDVVGNQPTVSIQQPIYNVNYGSSVVLVCTVTANPAHTTVYWRKIKNGITTDITVANSNNKYSGSSVSSPSLQINNADLNDEGHYACFATNIIGTSQSTQAFLDVTGDLLNVSIPQSSYSVLIGQQVTILCIVTGTPTQTNVFWRKVADGVQTNVDINGNSRYTGGTTSSPLLTITNTQRSDEGIYVCHATNLVGTSNSQNTFLDVAGDIPTVTIQQSRYNVNYGKSVVLVCDTYSDIGLGLVLNNIPVVTIPSNVYSVLLSGSITIQCTVSSNPSHTSVTWQRTVNGVLTTVTVDGSRIMGSSVSSPSLTISYAVSGDEGYYICTATNIVGTGTSQQTFLDVTGNIPIVNVGQNLYSGSFGQTVTMVCTVQANPTETSVYWRKIINGQMTNTDMNNVRYTGSTVGSPSLTITALELSDEGYFQCNAQNSVGTGSSQQTFLDVIGNIPVVTTPTASYTIYIGDLVTLTCTVTAYPQHTSVYWQYISSGSSTNVNIGGRFSGSSISSPSLTISNAQLSDQGTYVCYATNSIGTGQSTQVVMVVTGNVPSVNLTQTSFTGNYGDTITLGCTVSASPVVTSVYWQKVSGSTTSTVDMSNSRYTGSSVSTPSLTITNLNSNDAGNYVCLAANSVGTGQSITGPLTVVGNVPVVTLRQSTSSTNIGDTITLACAVSANPAHTAVYWTRQSNNGNTETLNPASSTKYSGSTTQSASLTINNVDTSDEGNYICHATNAFGTGQSSQTFLDVTGNAPTSIAIIPSPITVNEGQTVTATCTAQGSPTITYTWFKDNTNTQLSTGSVLQIISSTRTEAGTYLCRATNAFGNADAAVTIDVQYVPDVTIIQPSQRFEGQAVTIQCSYVSNPAATNIVWRKENQDITVDGNKYVGGTLSNPSLTITNLASSDQGLYRCSVVNSVGQEYSSSVTLSVDAPISGPAASLSDSSELSIGEIVAIVLSILILLLLFIVVCCCCKGYCVPLCGGQTGKVTPQEDHERVQKQMFYKDPPESVFYLHKLKIPKFYEIPKQSDEYDITKYIFLTPRDEKELLTLNRAKDNTSESTTGTLQQYYLHDVEYTNDMELKPKRQKDRRRRHYERFYDEELRDNEICVGDRREIVRS